MDEVMLACAKAEAEAEARREAAMAMHMARENVYRCSHCSGIEPRLFNLEDLKSHSRAK